MRFVEQDGKPILITLEEYQEAYVAGMHIYGSSKSDATNRTRAYPPLVFIGGSWIGYIPYTTISKDRTAHGYVMCDASGVDGFKSLVNPPIQPGTRVVYTDQCTSYYFKDILIRLHGPARAQAGIIGACIIPGTVLHPWHHRIGHNYSLENMKYVIPRHEKPWEEDSYRKEISPIRVIMVLDNAKDDTRDQP